MNEVIRLHFTPQGVQVVLYALAKMPYEQVADLIAEVRGQYQAAIDGSEVQIQAANE
jgi:hypothetical protein